jgi:protein required for attachment to host cells
LARRGGTVFPLNLTARLDAAINAGETKGLIMVAPPRTLGMIRQAYPQRLREVFALRDLRVDEARSTWPCDTMDMCYPGASCHDWEPIALALD